MSIQSEITRLQNAKTAIKTAIENKGVTVPSNTKLDGYANLVDSIETAPYIINPLNGGRFGPSINGQDGTFTYQYQVSGGTIADVCLMCTPSIDIGTRMMGSMDASSYGKQSPKIDGNFIFPRLVSQVYGYTITLTCTYNGLITGVFTCDENKWIEGGWLIVVILILTDGTKLVDTFIAPEGYIDY